VVFNSTSNLIYAISVNSAGTRIAFVDKNGTLRITDAKSNSIVRVVPAHSGRALDVKFSPDDRQIATCGVDKTVKIWDAGNFTNRPIVISKHNAWVLAVAFSSDGKYLLSSSEQETDLLLANTCRKFGLISYARGSAEYDNP
jgi:WD40 repeat protein